MMAAARLRPLYAPGSNVPFTLQIDHAFPRLHKFWETITDAQRKAFYCIAHDLNLTEWEVNFAWSISSKRGELSMKQIAVLGRIYRKAAYG